MRGILTFATATAAAFAVACGGGSGGGSGAGNGTFAAGTVLGLGASQGDIALADMDQDGTADLLAVRGGIFDQLIVHDGQANGFGPESPYALDGHEPRALGTGDFDDDGYTDVLVWCEDGIVDHLEAATVNNVLGVFDRTDLTGAGTAGARGLRVARLNGDADEDVIMGLAGALTRFDGTTGSGFLTSVDLSPSGFLTGIATPDLDGDGQGDLVGITLLGSVLVAENAGLGGFLAGTTHTLPTPASSATAWGLLDGADGTDVVVGLQAVAGGGVRVAVLPNLANGTANVGAPDIVTVTLGEQATVVALEAPDLDEDGDADLVVATAANVYVLMNNGVGAFTLADTLTPGGAIDAVAIGDVNGDGVLDVAVRAGGSVTPYFGNEG
ncbi:MAG: VCBS repeat-containing protein [Planctomycetia bacterium]|nr:VCBS repeat-containing protein [Planctomycetia bacterium]